MEESGGTEGFGDDEISLLAEELIHLSVKRPKVVPTDKLTLISSVWTKKSFNPESFKAQLKSMWKTKKKFKIQVASQNLFLIIFYSEEDLETVMKGRPWLFRKFVILFDRLRSPTERDQIRLTSSPFWIKICSCPPKFDKNDLIHAIDGTFGGILKSEIIGDMCKIRINLDVQKPLRRALKAESNLVGKESLKLKAYAKKLNSQRSYTCLMKQEYSGMKKFEDPNFKQGEKRDGRQVTACEERLKGASVEDEVKRCRYENWEGGRRDTRKDDDVQEEWRFTGFYGSPYAKDKNLE
ncbi:hypothetical protein J1N35_038795 [Gossypium stocksii]|uniref:DUF4283 domain-containing protein n=1 Tax=Gossypium stocksii TaxID=47602 RepID=A0A9D3UMF4_9ROSI|nr:hypothetical protein J1N35_038795 [Gossypium stocksii]